MLTTIFLSIVWFGRIPQRVPQTAMQCLLFAVKRHYSVWRARFSNSSDWKRCVTDGQDGYCYRFQQFHLARLRRRFAGAVATVAFAIRCFWSKRSLARDSVVRRKSLLGFFLKNRGMNKMFFSRGEFSADSSYENPCHLLRFNASKSNSSESSRFLLSIFRFLH